MRELFVDRVWAEDEAGERYCFEYSILIGEVDTGPFFCESYGVKVAQAGTENVCAVPNITTSAAAIDALVELLVDNAVTPVSLPEVLEDRL